MEVYLSINGVLRNLIQKFDYHYHNNFLEADIIVDEDAEPFDYKVEGEVQNDNLLNYYAFQSVEEYNNFLFVEFPLELFGHAAISYMSAMSDLNKIIYDHPDINFTVVGLDELGKAKPSTLFFLSKHSYMGTNIKFIRSHEIEKEWKKCDVWITDNKDIIDKCPKNKTAVKYVTNYNKYFTHKHEIEKLTECLKYWEKPTTSMWTRLLKIAGQSMSKNQQKETKIAKNNK
jgi:hypothetical protein